MAKPNRGYIFEAVWAAAVASRFYKRIGDIEKIQKSGAFEKSSSKRISLQTLPRVNANDVSNMLIQIWNSGKRLNTTTQNDVHFKSNVKDSLVISCGFPAAVDNLISGMVKTKNFSDISDFIRASASIVNGHSDLNTKVKRVAFNGTVDTINITADGLVDQRTVKADVTVTIKTTDKGPNISPFPVSCKVPGGEQFAQVSGLEFDKFVSLFDNLGLIIPKNIKDEWEKSVNEFINGGIFEKKYATKAAIIQTKAPTKTKAAASKVYAAMAGQMSSNFPTQQFANYIYQGFTSGVDTEVVKLIDKTVNGKKIMIGAKTITADDQFKKLLSEQTYTVKGSGSTIKIYAEGITGHIMQFRYRWENPSSADKKTYKMYARHYLEAGPGMFKIDPRSQEIVSKYK